MISASTGAGVDDLGKAGSMMRRALRIRRDQDRRLLPARLWPAEITREKSTCGPRGEPTPPRVETTAFRGAGRRRARHRADHLWERGGQRAIVWAQGGEVIKWIGNKDPRARNWKRIIDARSPVPAPSSQGELGRGAAAVQRHGGGIDVYDRPLASVCPRRSRDQSILERLVGLTWAQTFVRGNGGEEGACTNQATSPGE